MFYQSLGAYIGIFYEAIVIFILVLLLIDLYRLFKTEKIIMAKDLLFGFIFITIGIFFSWLAKWYLCYLGGEFSQAARMGDYFSKLIYKFKFSLSFAILGHYFILIFFRTIFSPEITRPGRSNKLIIRKIVEIIFIIISPLFGTISGDYNVTMLIDAIAFFITVIDALFLLTYAKKSFKHSKDEKFGKKYRNVGFLALLDFNFLNMVFFDRLTCVLNILGLFGGLGFSIFYFISWFSVLIAVIYAIYGFVRK